MTVGTKVSVTPAELLGDAHPLLEQIGVHEDVAPVGSIAAPSGFHRVSDLRTLRSFLDVYRTRVLFPVELPVIVAAYAHASRGEVRELIALDERLAREQAVQDFAAASCRVGQRQLGKLRPLRDARVVQRYIAALERGDARGWHTLVYGLGLAVFSLPLRQGLHNYANQTLGGFIQSSAKSLRLAEADCHALLAEQHDLVPRGIELALAETRLLTC